ncbi:hypothetical protein MtrunA17_Chr5g0398381 [Medicago truncatula]|uniref:Transmembrane protein n=1 Tax=Medicago truncatula TaxID=3880 RepID=A0A396HMK1_MEDTR|nr:hypothetical protein MtrunA17_Chr5g0398381 [Medicago truncatula]
MFLAPMSLLLHTCPPVNSQWPFHFAGGGGIPSSLKDGCKGNIPESMIPIMTPFPRLSSLHNPCPCFRPKNVGV